MATGTIQNNTISGDSNYCKLPDGTLMQWGNMIIGANNTRGDLTFPVPFIDTNYCISVVPHYEATRDVVLTISFISTTGVAVYQKTASSSDQSVRWLAVGRWK